MREESEFRRGYHEGYTQAINDFFDLLTRENRKPGAVFDLLTEHCDDALWDWSRKETDDSFENPPYVEIKRRRRAITKLDRLLLFERDDGICGICHKPIGFAKWNIDHIDPVAKGGFDDWSNLQVAHEKCNFSKHAG